MKSISREQRELKTEHMFDKRGYCWKVERGRGATTGDKQGMFGKKRSMMMPL